MGYSWGIHGVFMGYTYVSVMYRLCVGYVSVMCRLCDGAYGQRGERFISNENNDNNCSILPKLADKEKESNNAPLFTTFRIMCIRN